MSASAPVLDEIKSRRSPFRPGMAADEAWKVRVREILNRHPAVGLVVGVVRDAQVEFAVHGYADLATKVPVTEHTVFRVGSITKTFTAIAIMQLVEEGGIELDAPASDYLRSYKLTRRERGFALPTVRQMLTHTSGIPDARHFVDLLHFTWGPWDGRPPSYSVPYGQVLPSLADYYCDGLEVVVEPGSAFAYSNAAFATLGQIVEDISGMPLARYLRERVFEPLGMTDTSLVRNEHICARLATGYLFGQRGPRAVPDRAWIDAGAGGVYSTARDLAGYAMALLDQGGNVHGRVLQPETLATMFDIQYQSDPALPALGLAFFRSEVGGRRVVGHDGILPGFNSHLAVAPEEGIGLIALTNGSSAAMRWIPTEMDRLLGRLLGVPDEERRVDLPHHPEIWHEICGRYVLPARIGDLRGRIAMGPGLEVLIRGGRPVVRLWWPVPVVSRPSALLPDGEDDPHAFRLDLSGIGVGQVHLRFRRDPTTGRRMIHTDLGGQPISFEEAQRDYRPRVWATALLALSTAAVVAHRTRSLSHGRRAGSVRR